MLLCRGWRISSAYPTSSTASCDNDCIQFTCHQSVGKYMYRNGRGKEMSGKEHASELWRWICLCGESWSEPLRWSRTTLFPLQLPSAWTRDCSKTYLHW